MRVSSGGGGAGGPDSLENHKCLLVFLEKMVRVPSQIRHFGSNYFSREVTV